MPPASVAKASSAAAGSDADRRPSRSVDRHFVSPPLFDRTLGLVRRASLLPRPASSDADIHLRRCKSKLFPVEVINRFSAGMQSRRPAAALRKRPGRPSPRSVPRTRWESLSRWMPSTVLDSTIVAGIEERRAATPGHLAQSAGRTAATSPRRRGTSRPSQSTSSIGGGATTMTAGAAPPGPASLRWIDLGREPQWNQRYRSAVRDKPLLEVVGAEHEDDEVERHVRFEADRQGPQAVLVDALDRVVMHRRAARMAFLDDLPAAPSCLRMIPGQRRSGAKRCRPTRASVGTAP